MRKSSTFLTFQSEASEWWRLPPACCPPIRVEWFSTFLNFSNMAKVSELDLLVLRPSVKEKNEFALAPPSGRAPRFRNAQSHQELKNKSLIPKLQKSGQKNAKENSPKGKFGIRNLFLKLWASKKQLFLGCLCQRENTFFVQFLTFIGKYMYF
jgi:hypothetical protein